ncbi:hypothetical protein QBC34DRAFT_384485 [Podospora aff. communis PSN243]|uniref:Uncharacterized protein n=1 Tax=Podospora aff. communis PSN243 TaxID=3040156 RepID=A0AAV9GBE3_9PEZI|nr:hypothetical protein QBC34DRAFT_384485 [Podospora aff. communis PSN243]
MSSTSSLLPPLNSQPTEPPPFSPSSSPNSHSCSPIGAAYWRVIGVPPQRHSWTNVEAYSIAISAPFLYISPAVLFSALIGVSQTQTQRPPHPQRVPNPHNPPPAHHLRRALRLASRHLLSPCPLLHPPAHHLLAASFVFFSVLVAAFISYRVPPEGFDCRTAAQTAILGVWVLSFVLDFAITGGMESCGHLHGRQVGTGKEGRWYVLTFVKDTIFGLATISSILVTQLGMFNRCDCFTLWGRVPVMLPEIDQVKEVLMQRIAKKWPAVTFVWTIVEFLRCGVVWWWYRDAVRLYVQRDDGGSNAEWVQR